MVHRVYTEKKEELAEEARALLSDIRGLLRIPGVRALRILNRYDVEHLEESLFLAAIRTVFSEPQTDLVYRTLPEGGDAVFAVEYLPGQYDQRADSAAQCIQMIAQTERPLIRTAKVYLLYGTLSESELAAIQKYVINPVEARAASLALPDTLEIPYEAVKTVPRIDGFCGMDDAALRELMTARGLAMDEDDLALCRAYFEKEGRDPTETELRVIDTYWSDHCRHTTFLSHIDRVTFDDPLAARTYEDYLATRKALGREEKPICLMDLATVAMKYEKAIGNLEKLDESEEINACTVKIQVEADGKQEDWLLLFKNETHNHPTEIEPFGGAATCIGGAIRDPLSGRSYVYGAMRLSGAGNPLSDFGDTLPGKLPQRKIVTGAANGYSSYGNQIGLATGIVDEIYHPGYTAKRMEIGAVIAAAPRANVRRERPVPGDVVILLGGNTGRDGCGGATGSSKSHTKNSLQTCGAEVQKGNAPEERKLQRLFRNPDACRLIKRCNDFGAGGVSVAIGELADGLQIDLNAVPKKYEGLSGTELAISESQERMAVVVAAKDRDAFLALADAENLSATPVAVVSEKRRLQMCWNGATIVDIDRAFLDTNGAEKHVRATVAAPTDYEKPTPADFTAGYLALADDLNTCSHRGLSEQFDATIGAGTVLMPYGGKYQLTPIQAMVQKISLEEKHTDDCSLMAWGYNPFITEKNPYHGAYLAVVESVAKLVACGAEFSDVYLTFQEYFERLEKDPLRWGKPIAALLGAFAAQKGLGIASIGGKDSMSGSFENLHVPPTLVSFAVTTAKTGDILSPEFKRAGDRVVLLSPDYDENGLPTPASLLALFRRVREEMQAGHVRAAYTPTLGGIAEAVMKMSFGNRLGFSYAPDLTNRDLFSYRYGAFLLEVSAPMAGAREIGCITEEDAITRGTDRVALSRLLQVSEEKLEGVFRCNIPTVPAPMETFSSPAAARPAPRVFCAKPRVLIPVFPGTNCEYDSARAMRDAGAEPEIFIIRNRTPGQVTESVRAFAAHLAKAQMVLIPGGFSGGDEPDGSGKFITAFFRNAAIRDGVAELLEKRDGLMCGICNGFQALIKLGLVPYGRITDADAASPTLTYNRIARHQSRIVRTRIASNRSPWLAATEVGDIYTVPISHGEGRLYAEEALIRSLAANGQIATQYVDDDGAASADIRYNPNGSAFAVEGMTSPDGRVFGKMGHTERYAPDLYRNVPGNYDMPMFLSAVRYFR